MCALIQIPSHKIGCVMLDFSQQITIVPVPVPVAYEKSYTLIQDDNASYPTYNYLCERERE